MTSPQLPDPIPPENASTPASPSASTTGAFMALLLAVLSFSLLQTFIIPALPQLKSALHTDSSTISWTISAFLLSSSVGTVIIGRLGDLYGRKKLMLISLAILALGSLLAAISESITLLITARVIQGLGAATFPLAFGLVREVFPREKIAVVIGTISAVFGIGFGVGLVVPGPIIATLGWPSLFWISLIIVIIAAITVLIFIRTAPTPTIPGSIDWSGTLLLTLALVSLLLAVSQSRSWSLWLVLAFLVLAVAAFWAFITVENRIAQPLMNMAVLRRRPVLAANLVALIVGFGMYGAFTLVPQLVQTPTSAGYGFGAGTTEAGLFLLPMAVTMLVAGPLAGRLGPRWGWTPTLASACVINAVGFALLVFGSSEIWAITTAAGIIGIGIGFAFASLTNVLIASVESHETSEATGVNTVVRTIGGALGAQVSAAVVSSTLIPGTHLPAQSGYITAFVISGVAMLIAAAAALTNRNSQQDAG